MSTNNKTGTFKSLFYTIGNPKEFSATTWKHFFIPFDHEKWIQDIAGGLVYKLPNGEEFSLLIEYYPKLGLTLSYEMTDVKNDDSFDTWISVYDPKLMNQFVALETGSWQPEGSFLAPESAWCVVAAFLDNPTVLPECAQWMNAADLNWPEPL